MAAKRLKWKKNRREILERVNKIRDISREFGYDEEYFKEKESVIRLSRDGKMIDVWFTSLTVAVFEFNEALQEMRPKFFRVDGVENLAEIM